MAISSQGIGSGLDVNSIVTQLVAIEKQPLKTLQTAASKLQSQVSVYGTIKSQISTLQDAATALAKDSSWAVQSATSSDTTVATVSVDSTASSTEFSLTTNGLARAQSIVSQGLEAGVSVGAPAGTGTGTLTIRLGSWATGSFVIDGDVDPVDVVVNESDDYAAIASAINAANAGLKATVLTVGSTERLSVQSTSTGADTGFTIESDGGFVGLDSLSYTSEALTPSASGMQKGQRGSDASVEFNGVQLSSTSNTLTNIVPGVTVNLMKEGSSSQISVIQDKTAIQSNIQAFADAYTALSKTLADATKYVQGGQSGPLQGDTTTVGLQRLLRQIIGSTTSGSGSAFTNLSKVGLELQTDGSLKLNSTSLKTAMADMTGLQTLFTYVADPSKTVFNKQTDGFGVKLREFAKELLGASGGLFTVSKDNGYVTNKAAALQASIARNSDEQDKVNLRAASVEKRLRVQYSALDAKMATMSSLSSYVTAQLAQWNKSTS